MAVALAAGALLSSCGTVLPATQTLPPPGIFSSLSNAVSATPVTSASDAASASPQPAPTATKPPFIPTPYSPPGPPSTLSNQQAQATRVALESKIADADRQLRSVSFTPPTSPTPVR